jgi:hypothetical protein
MQAASHRRFYLMIGLGLAIALAMVVALAVSAIAAHVPA